MAAFAKKGEFATKKTVNRTVRDQEWRLWLAVTALPPTRVMIGPSHAITPWRDCGGYPSPHS